MRVVVTVIVFWIAYWLFYTNTDFGQERTRCGTVVKMYDTYKYVGKYYDSREHLFEMTIKYDDTDKIELLSVNANTFNTSKENERICFNFGNIWDNFTFIFIGFVLSLLFGCIAYFTYIDDEK